jgi:hypothetical protein
MRIYAKHRYPLTAEVWDWYTTNAEIPVKGTPLFFYKRTTIKLSFASDPNAPRSNFLTTVPVRKYAQLRNIKDEYGKLIMPEDTVYTITQAEPNLNVFGTQEGYNMRCALAYMGDYEYTFEEDLPAGAQYTPAGKS